MTGAEKRLRSTTQESRLLTTRVDGRVRFILPPQTIAVDLKFGI